MWTHTITSKEENSGRILVGVRYTNDQRVNDQRVVDKVHAITNLDRLKEIIANDIKDLESFDTLKLDILAIPTDQPLELPTPEVPPEPTQAELAEKAYRNKVHKLKVMTEEPLRLGIITNEAPEYVALLQATQQAYKPEYYA